MQVRQLIPEARQVEILDLLSDLALAGRAGDERPYTVANFISSADGRAAFQGRSGQLGDQADREMFHGLREQVEAVLVGTVTMRLERYGRLTRDPERRARRVQAGLASDPLMCVVTRRGDVPTEAPVFSEPEARVIVFGPPGTQIDHVPAQVEIVALDPGEMTLTTAMRRLRADFGIRTLLCEGGPTLFGGLLAEGLIDELFLTLAPKLVAGGSEPTISSGPELRELSPLGLAWLAEYNDSLFLRYCLR